MDGTADARRWTRSGRDLTYLRLSAFIRGFYLKTLR